MLEPTAKANIPPIRNFGGIPGRSAKFGWRRTLTRRIVAPMLVPEQLQRMTLTTPTTKTVAGREKPTTIASHSEKMLIHPVYESASTRINWDNANGSNAYGNRRRVPEKIGNVATNESQEDRNFDLSNFSFKYAPRGTVSDVSRRSFEESDCGGGTNSLTSGPS